MDFIDLVVLNRVEDGRLLSVEVDEELTVGFSFGKYHLLLSEFLVNTNDVLELILVKHECVKPQLDKEQQSVLNLLKSPFVEFVCLSKCASTGMLFCSFEQPKF